MLDAFYQPFFCYGSNKNQAVLLSCLMKTKTAASTYVE